MHRSHTNTFSIIMSIDKFGRHRSPLRSAVRTTLHFNSDGDLDLDNRKIVRVGDPQFPTDAVNKRSALGLGDDNNYCAQNRRITHVIDPEGPHHVLNLSYYRATKCDCEYKVLKNVGKATEDTDGTNKIYVDTIAQHLSAEINAISNRLTVLEQESARNVQATSSERTS